MKICIFGAGYVGLVAAACFAESGNSVIAVDVDEAKINGLKEGIIPIYEPGLKELVLRNSAEGRLTFTTDLPSAAKASLIIFIAVGTPPGEDGSAQPLPEGPTIAQEKASYFPCLNSVDPGDLNIWKSGRSPRQYTWPSSVAASRPVLLRTHQRRRHCYP